VQFYLTLKQAVHTTISVWKVNMNTLILSSISVSCVAESCKWKHKAPGLTQRSSGTVFSQGSYCFPRRLRCRKHRPSRSYTQQSHHALITVFLKTQCRVFVFCMILTGYRLNPSVSETGSKMYGDWTKHFKTDRSYIWLRWSRETMHPINRIFNLVRHIL
jgi:hypothetical protein